MQRCHDMRVCPCDSTLAHNGCIDLVAILGEDANPGTSCEGMRVRPNPSRVTMVRAMQLHKKMQTHTRRYNDLVFILSSCEGMRVRPNPSSMRSRIELLAAECAPRSGHDNLFSYLLTKLPALLSYFVLRIAQNSSEPRPEA